MKVGGVHQGRSCSEQRVLKSLRLCFTCVLMLITRIAFKGLCLIKTKQHRQSSQVVPGIPCQRGSKEVGNSCNSSSRESAGTCRLCHKRLRVSFSGHQVNAASNQSFISAPAEFYRLEFQLENDLIFCGFIQAGLLVFCLKGKLLGSTV